MRFLNPNENDSVYNSVFKFLQSYIEGKDKPRQVTDEEEAKDVLTLERESNISYQGIVKKIVDDAGLQLIRFTDAKSDLRKKFFSFFILLLWVQFAVVVLLLVFDGFHLFGFEVTDYMMSVFIGSVFVETLAAVGIMIGFAFASNDEVRIIELLTAVVESYQRYHGKVDAHVDPTDEGKK